MTTIQRIATLTVATTMLLILAACGDSSTNPSPWSTLDDPTTETAPAPTPPRYTPSEQAYLDTLDSLTVPYADPDGIVRAAYAVCDYLDVEVPRVGISAAVTGAGQIITDAGGYTYRDAVSIVGAAAGALCPEHEPAAGGEW